MLTKNLAFHFRSSLKIFWMISVLFVSCHKEEITPPTPSVKAKDFLPLNQGGLQKLQTSFGELDCICTKTAYNVEQGLQLEYHYFCKDIGICLIEKDYIDEDSTGNSFISFTWRRNLTGYQLTAI